MLHEYQHYYILEKPGDAERIKRIRLSDASFCYVPVSASAMAEAQIKQLSPMITLDMLTTHKELKEAIAAKRDFTWSMLCREPLLPHYKIKMLLDSFIEKEVIVDLLSSLKGEKHFISQPGGYVNLLPDMSEGLRSAALYMAGRDDFYACSSERCLSLNEYLRPTAYALAKAWRSKSFRPLKDVPFITEKGYGITSSYENIAHTDWDIGSVGICIAKSDLSFCKKAKMLWLWLLLYRPFRFHAESTLCFGLIQTYLNRYAKARYVVSELFHAEIIKPRYVFGATYTDLLTNALVAESRIRHIPVISMQHAAVGHDEWLGVRYADAWLADAKIVSGKATMATLTRIEEAPNCQYIPAMLPHFSDATEKLKPWDGACFIYIATGFVRNNIMYDQRRLNDCLYYVQMQKKLEKLSAHFNISFKPHPFDKRQNLPVTELLAKQFHLPLIDQPTRALTQAAIIDSPSTVLADLTLAGIPVFILNATCTLSKPFQALAERTFVMHSDADSLIQYIKNTKLEDVLKSQQEFRADFLKLYLCNENKTSIPEVISSWFDKATHG